MVLPRTTSCVARTGSAPGDAHNQVLKTANRTVGRSYDWSRCLENYDLVETTIVGDRSCLVGGNVTILTRVLHAIVYLHGL